VKFEEPEDHGGAAVIVGLCGLQFSAEFLDPVFQCAGLFELLHQSLESGPWSRLSAEGLEQSLCGGFVGLNEQRGQCRLSLRESPQALIIPHHRKAEVHTGRAKLLLSRSPAASGTSVAAAPQKRWQSLTARTSV